MTKVNKKNNSERTESISIKKQNNNKTLIIPMI